MVRTCGIVITIVKKDIPPVDSYRSKGERPELIERARQKRMLSCSYVFHKDGERIGSFGKAWKTASAATGLGKFVEAKTNGQQKEQDKAGKKKTKKYAGIIVHDLR